MGAVVSRQSVDSPIGPVRFWAPTQLAQDARLPLPFDSYDLEHHS
jgi:hypothetical protein